MKRKRRWQKILLTVTMLVMMAVTTIAARAAETITLTVKASEPGHTFEAYQIFGGTYTIGEDGKGILSDIVWGNALNGSGVDVGLLADLKKDGILGEFFKDAENAAGVARVLQNAENFANNSENLDRFAVIVEGRLGETNTSFGTGTASGDYYLYEATLAPGYYLVKDKKNNDVDTNGSYTKFMLELVSNTTVDAKLDTPTLDKVIVGEGNATSGTSSAVIGSTVTFKLTSTVPDMDGYNRYHFVVKDTLSKGLEYVGNESTIIKVGDTTLSEGTHYTVTSESNGEGQLLKIVFENFLTNWKKDAGKTIEITYGAKLTKDAVAGTAGNKNSAQLIYSNDPSYSYSGDEPGDGTPTGQTTETTTHTYTTKMKVGKIDADTKKLITGATFELSGNGIQATITATDKVTTTYAEDSKGDFVNIDGKMVPYDPGQHQGKIRYKEVKVTDTVVTTEGSAGKVEASVDANGYMVFTGLGAGEYTLKETKAPEGYNKIDNPIIIKIACTLPTDEEYAGGQTDCTWKYTYNGSTLHNSDADGTVYLLVENRKGSMLPSTGGVGTTIFTITGLILMLGAILFLAAKNKREKAE